MSYKELLLPNGIKIVTDEMPDAKSVSMAIGVGVGSRDETPELSGISHFVEHMIFKGTAKMNVKEIAEFFDGLGAQYNAYTSKESTFFYFKVLDEYWHRAAPALADMVFDSMYPTDELNRERGVILEEINESNDDPFDSVYDLYMSSAYADQQLGRPILGYKENIKTITQEQMKLFVRKNYTGKNIAVSVAGNIKHDDVVSLLTPILSGINGGPRVQSGVTVYTGGYVTERRDLEQLQVYFGFPGVGIGDDDYYVYRITGILLGGGMASRLFQEVREKLGLAYSISSYSASYRNKNGQFSVKASTSPGTARQLIEVSMGQIVDLSVNVTESELVRAKNKIKSSILLNREESMSRALWNGNSHLMYNRHLTIEEIRNNVDRVTLDDIKRIVRNILNNEKKTLALLGNFNNDIDYYKLLDT